VNPMPFEQWVAENRDEMHEVLMDGDYSCPCCGADVGVSADEVDEALDSAVAGLVHGHPKIQVLKSELRKHYREQFEEDRMKLRVWTGAEL